MTRRLVPAAVVVALLSLPQIATAQFIGGSKHDFSATLGINRICEPCHTPHNADTSVVAAPLWNHALTTATFTPYTTLQGRTGDPDGPSKLCLSCHDGTVALDNYGGAAGTVFMTGPALLDADLRDDHPIGLSYPPPDATRYHPTVTVRAAGIRLPNDGLNDRVECQSCHDPHTNLHVPFLRIDNTNSALCMTCHNL